MSDEPMYSFERESSSDTAEFLMGLGIVILTVIVAMMVGWILSFIYLAQ